MSDGLRHEKLDNLLRIALKMQASAEGVSLSDIEAELGVSHRTAQRMKDALLRNFPAIEIRIDTDSQQHRYYMPPGSLGRMAEPKPEEISALYRAGALMTREGDAGGAQQITALADRLMGAVDRKRRNRLAPDIEALMEADGVALRPGPHENLDPAIMAQLRKAILSAVWITVEHRTRSGQLTWNIRLGPLGMLLGQGRQYLVAFSEYAQAVRLFALSGFERVALTTTPFVAPPGFNLKTYAHNSFGVWQEEPENVVWRFSAKVARDAASYRFHPSETHEPQPDGSLIVRFRAGGLQEMAWRLARWAGEIEVLEPARLQHMVRELGARLAGP